MGVINAIIALCKAVPILERLFLDVADGIKEHRAKSRLSKKRSFIDDAIADARVGMQESDVQGAERSGGVDGASSVHRSSKASSRLDKSGTE